ncbi:hypothetical protein K523DRAFT_354315 [Schizophyllum commune Tattone D]|nr:hypothetical protein K523DRAFT_354315 [Schizophyllum commune Tattone D]
MPTPTRSPPLLFPVSLPPSSTSTPKRQVYLHSRDRPPRTATEVNDSSSEGTSPNSYDGPILYALGYLTTPASIAEAATQRGFGVCGDSELTVHAFLRRLENATGVCEGNGLMEVRMARDVRDDQIIGAREAGRQTAPTGGSEEALWLILVKGMSPRVEDMVVPDILLQRFQQSMPTEEMPALYRIAADGGGEAKGQAKTGEHHSLGPGSSLEPPSIFCHCPRRSRLVLGYVTSPHALHRQALRTGTAIPGDFAATLERILRRIRRLTGRALSDTVLKLDGGGWLLIVADAADLGRDEVAQVEKQDWNAVVARQTAKTEETLDALYARCSEATISAFRRLVGTTDAPGAYNCDFPCSCVLLHNTGSTRI